MARGTPGRRARLFVPLLALSAAVAQHAVWNAAASAAITRARQRAHRRAACRAAPPEDRALRHGPADRALAGARHPRARSARARPAGIGRNGLCSARQSAPGADHTPLCRLRAVDR
jgi:hypothetical protein